MTHDPVRLGKDVDDRRDTATGLPTTGAASGALAPAHAEEVR